MSLRLHHYRQKVCFLFRLVKYRIVSCSPVQRRSAYSTKSQILIKRPIHIKPHPRSRQSDDPTTTVAVPPNVFQASSSTHVPNSDEDELSRVRTILRPPPMTGVPDWGIPPASSTSHDPDIEVCDFASIACNIVHGLSR